VKQNVVITFFCTIQATEYCRFARLGSRGGRVLYFRPGSGYVGADLAKHRNPESNGCGREAN